MTVVRLKSSNSDLALEFSHRKGDSFRVALVGRDHSAAREVYAPADEPGLPRLFSDGKVWESLDGELRLELAGDRLGHMKLRVRIRSDQGGPDPWEHHGELELDAGLSDEIARDLERFWGEAMTKAMTQYEYALTAMNRLLRIVGETNWGSAIESHLAAWRESGDARGHRSIYGGMGSFNDVMICRRNGHRIAEAQEPWAGALFEWLKGACYFLSRNPDSFFSAEDLARSVGRYDASLSAFIGGADAPDAMRGFPGSETVLQSWRCFACRHAESSMRAIDGMLASTVVPILVLEACARMGEQTFVDRILAGDVDGIAGMRREAAAAMAASGIATRADDGWMRPCPKCGGSDTGLYRWRLVGGRFEPAADNLPEK